MNSIISENIRSYQKKWGTIKSPQSIDNEKKLRKCSKCGKEWVTKNRYQFRCYTCHEYEELHQGVRDERWLTHV